MQHGSMRQTVVRREHQHSVPCAWCGEPVEQGLHTTHNLCNDCLRAYQADTAVREIRHNEEHH